MPKRRDDAAPAPAAARAAESPPQPPAVAEDVVGPREHRLRFGALARERELRARRCSRCETVGLDRSPIEDLADAAGEMQFVHGFVGANAHRVTPRAFSAAAKACVAREQCVFTLPSEQPMTCAVSATSSSSQ